MFEAWILGKNNEDRFITCSYSDELAKDFSRYVRDTISEVKNTNIDIVYNDIFPLTKVKYGDATYKKWALEGQFFNYLGTSLGSQITGRGCSIILMDDLVKDASTAMNENALDDIYKWYTGTLLSRKEEGAIEIMCMTRWADKDPIGRVLSTTGGSEWYILNMEAYDQLTDTMLCPELLSKQSYLDLKRDMDPIIFGANYHNHLINAKGRLYTELKEYVTPLTYERVIAYIDTADQGNDYLACIIAGIYKGQAYIKDIYYTKDAMEITEPEVAKLLHKHQVNLAHIESNNGGRGFARNVERLLWDNHKSRSTKVEWFHQSANKKARILSNATNVMNNIYFPINWQTIYKDAYLSMIAYQREGKNKNDDLQDALTGLQEKMNVNNKWVFAK